MINSKPGFVLILLILIQTCCLAQERWALRKTENGISVYSRMLTNEKYKEIRVTCEFKATPDQLIKVLQNVGDHKNWVYKTVASHLVKKVNKDTLFYYSEIELPWPVSNRDAVTQLSVAKDSVKNYLITVRSFPNMVPKQKGLVRVPYSLGQYRVSPVNNHIKIDYTLTVDPGGSIPAWLVNYTATIAPYNTFVKLRELVEKQN